VTGVGAVQVTGLRSGRMYNERMVAAPDDSVSWRSPAGIHSARVGGSTQAAELVRTVSTPLAAQASWCSEWVCQSNTDPAGIGKVATMTAPSSGPVHCSS